MMRWLFLLLLVSAWMPNVAVAARILALTPHACEMLYAIGAGDQIVGTVSYCDYPEAALRLPRIGSYERINAEAALRLKPDVAVVLNRNVGGIELLQRMGVRIVESNPSDFESIFADIETLGSITGKKNEAAALVQSLRARLERVRSSAATAVPVYYEVWHDPMLTAGGPSFITDLIRQAGGRNVFADIGVETPHVSVEAVVRANPAVIVVPLEKRRFEERCAFWERWLGKGKVHFVSINPDLLSRPGPRLLDGLEQLQKAIAGAAKK